MKSEHVNHEETLQKLVESSEFLIHERLLSLMDQVKSSKVEGCAEVGC